MNHDPDVVKEVPDALQRLVRFTVRGFYGIEHALTVDVLVRNGCVKEEDIQELLKFDKKQLRSALNQLKNDKFLKSSSYVQTQLFWCKTYKIEVDVSRDYAASLLQNKMASKLQEDDKMTKHNYYYINYRSVANVIKYKLHHMHKRIETMERDSTNRPSFKCPECKNTYSDLEVNQLVDPMSGTLNCTFCRTEVEEDKAAHNEETSRVSQAKFNEQMEPVYKMLREVEDITLSDEILEPKPAHIPHLHPNGVKTSKSHKNKHGDHWTTGRAAVDFGHEQNVVIDMGEQKEHVAKEVPLWMSESTVTESSKSAGNENPAAKLQPAIDASDQRKNDEVLQTLLVQEGSSKGPTLALNSHRDSREAESESDEFEDVEDETMVTVAGQLYRYEEVVERGQEFISRMTPQEKEAYIEIGQRLYEDMHD